MCSRETRPRGEGEQGRWALAPTSPGDPSHTALSVLASAQRWAFKFTHRSLLLQVGPTRLSPASDQPASWRPPLALPCPHSATTQCRPQCSSPSRPPLQCPCVNIPRGHCPAPDPHHRPNTLTPVPAAAPSAAQAAPRPGLSPRPRLAWRILRLQRDQAATMRGFKENYWVNGSAVDIREAKTKMALNIQVLSWYIWVN